MSTLQSLFLLAGSLFIFSTAVSASVFDHHMSLKNRVWHGGRPGMLYGDNSPQCFTPPQGLKKHLKSFIPNVFNKPGTMQKVVADAAVHFCDYADRDACESPPRGILGFHSYAQVLPDGRWPVSQGPWAAEGEKGIQGPVCELVVHVTDEMDIVLGRRHVPLSTLDPIKRLPSWNDPRRQCGDILTSMINKCFLARNKGWVGKSEAVVRKDRMGKNWEHWGALFTVESRKRIKEDEPVYPPVPIDHDSPYVDFNYDIDYSHD